MTRNNIHHRIRCLTPNKRVKALTLIRLTQTVPGLIFKAHCTLLLCRQYLQYFMNIFCNDEIMHIANVNDQQGLAIIQHRYGIQYVHGPERPDCLKEKNIILVKKTLIRTVFHSKFRIIISINYRYLPSLEFATCYKQALYL